MSEGVCRVLALRKTAVVHGKAGTHVQSEFISKSIKGWANTISKARSALVLIFMGRH